MGIEDYSSDEDSDSEDYEDQDRSAETIDGLMPREVIDEGGNIVDEANKFSTLVDDIIGDDDSDDDDYGRKRK